MADKDNSESFKFEEDNSMNSSNKPNWLDPKPSDNPFDNNPFKEANINSSDENSQQKYKIENESIRANRSQSNSLALVLLALLASIGLLIAAIWGLTNSNKNNDIKPIQAQNNAKTPNSKINQNRKTNINNQSLKEGRDFCSLSLESQYKEKSLPILEAEREQVENELIALEEKENLTSKEEMRLENLQARLEALDENIAEAKKIEALVCRLDEAEKYISESIGNLERVTSKIEERAEEAKENKDQGQIQFLKEKLENLARAEAEVRAFSQPYIQKDLTIGFDSENAPCKIKDAPQYLANWLDQVKNRINALQISLSQDSTAEEETKAFQKPEIKTSEKPEIKTNNIAIKEAKSKIIKEQKQAKRNNTKAVSSGFSHKIKTLNKAQINKSAKSTPTNKSTNISTLSSDIKKETSPVEKIISDNSPTNSVPRKPSAYDNLEVETLHLNQSFKKPPMPRRVETCYEEDYYYEEEVGCQEEPEIYYEDCGSRRPRFRR